MPSKRSSRRTRRSKKAIWDGNPHQIYYKGQTIEAFTRSAVAKALNRELITIRTLEKRGILCNPALIDGHGWWMYTRDQIEDLITLAQEEGVLDPRFHNPFSDRFITEAHMILKRLPQ